MKDYTIENLGKREHLSPLVGKFYAMETFVNDSIRVRHDPFIIVNEKKDVVETGMNFELAGPREYNYFNPTSMRSAIVTCGGLCPGLNDVIRAIVMTSHYHYGSKDVIGIPYGYNGLNPGKGYGFLSLNPDLVKDIHRDGGTILGSSRGGTEEMEKLVDHLVNTLKVRILYTIGGDGTLRGARKINELARSMGRELAVVGVP